MEWKLTPSAIEQLLIINKDPCDFREKEMTEKVFEMFKEFEVISLDTTTDLWDLTPRGEALVELLCSTPLPIMAFADPRTNELIGSCTEGQR